MNEAISPSTENPNRLQVSLSTLLLLIATVAIWFGYWSVSRELQRLQSQMPGLLSLSRELEVIDPSQSAVVARLPEWLGESIWDVYLPPDRQFELCLALDEVSEDSLAVPLHRCPIESGYRTIELKYETPRAESIASLLVDEQVVIEETRPPDWEPRRGSRGGSSISKSRQLDPALPMVLYRKRFRVPGVTSPARNESPTQGILVWIEPKKVDSP